MKTALITGACGGIGSSVARRLSKAGYALVLVDMDEPLLKALAKELATDCTIRVLDVTQREALSKFCDDLSSLPLDVAFINAGVVQPGHVIDLSFEDIDRQLDINLRGAICLIHALSRHFVAQARGHIIATVSMGGLLALKGSAAYSASKFGLRGFLMALDSELKPHGVLVSGLYPSAVDTAMLKYEATHGGNVLNFLGKPLTADAIAEAFMNVLTRPKLEVYLPYGDSIGARLVGVFPRILPKLMPCLEWLGERGRKKYLTSIKE